MAGRNGGGDGFVLVPERLALRLGLQHGAHRAAQVAPVLVGALADQRIARGLVDGLVESHVGIDHGFDIAPARCTAAALQQLGVDAKALCGCKPRGQHVERAAHLVDLAHPLGVERRHQHAAAGRVVHETVLLEQAQRLQHGLARHRQALRDVFLRDPLAGRQRAAADGAEQGAVDLVDEVGRGFDADELGGHGWLSLNSVYRVRNPAPPRIPGFYPWGLQKKVTRR